MFNVSYILSGEMVNAHRFISKLNQDPIYSSVLLDLLSCVGLKVGLRFWPHGELLRVNAYRLLEIIKWGCFILIIR